MDIINDAMGTVAYIAFTYFCFKNLKMEFGAVAYALWAVVSFGIASYLGA
tara:strand:+ start:514 stop:663 length:150 start_codon:yes stop_codon:yes gene_type:complete